MERTHPAASSDLELAASFRGRPAAEASPDDAELGASLRRLFEEGARAWPGLDLAPDVFVRHLAARSDAGRPPTAERAIDLYLACACAAQVRGALDAFDRAHLRPVGAYLARIRPSAALVDEVQQALREKLLMSKDGNPPRIAEYDGRGALASWVRVVALRAAIDLRRRSPAEAPEPPREPEDPATTDPEGSYLKQRYRDAFNTAVRGAIATLGSEQRELLRLHFVEGMTLDRIAAQAGVHRATIARRIDAACEAVADDTRRLLRAALGANESELASLAGVMRSQLELSLRGLLRQG